MREDTTQEIRYGQCHKLLARGWARDAHIIHKCPRCGAYNTLRATRPSSAPHDGLSEPKNGRQD
ncbi:MULTISPECIES: Com family DNA-binding transcriptional regulator [unclassified Desulfovibrio]|uniref:Com family DNA-binding transcriptional regulator n=1 Tax=unclassified Desulfovibrio TaxID=2593640 RepID=UPI0013ECBB1F|nr:MULTISPECIES: Com family DNA-binding transcriptional regulator [unclassified Desulfovibrio]